MVIRPEASDSYDPLDLQLGAATVPARTLTGRGLRRAGLGLKPTPLPFVALLAAGFAVGPHGIALLETQTLDAVRPLISVAAAALGALVGLGIDFRSRREPRLLAVATIESATTLVAVGAAFVVTAAFAPESTGRTVLALLAGSCAAVSASEPTRSAGPGAHMSATRATDLDDVLSILAAGALAAMLTAGTWRAAAVVVGASAAAGWALAYAGGLLVQSTRSEGEQGVFVVAALLLVAGVSEYLHALPLLVGLAAGGFWSASGRGGDIGRNVHYLQHAVLVLILGVGGARLEFSLRIVLLGAVLFLARLAGKLVGARLARAAGGEDFSPLSGQSMLSPGIVAAGIALCVADQSSLARDSGFLSIVLIGCALSDLLSLATSRQEDR
jgi:hypothetical protein